MANKYIFNIIILNIVLFTVKCSFQVNIFRELNTFSEKKNLCISPLSIYQILSLVSNGAKGKTQEEIVNILTDNNKNKTVIDLNQINNKIINIIKQSKELEIGNAILTKFNPEESFVLSSKKYDAFITKLISASQVNQWCSEKTHGKITKIIDNISNIEMLLINAVYFKGEWLVPFSSSFESKYYPSKSSKEGKQVMTMSKKFTSPKYFQDGNVQIIELPYKSGNTSAIIFLPNKKILIDQFISSYLTDQNLKKYLEGLNRIDYDVKLYLPKFEIEYESSLVNVLKKMGMKYPFDDLADFSNMNKAMPLKISEVIHKTYMKVDENGTEAAAVTLIPMVGCAMFEPKIEIEMRVDRPFIFAIRDKNIDEFLFLAKIDDI